MKLEASTKEQFGVWPGQILSLGASLPRAGMTNSYWYTRKKKHSTKIQAFRGESSAMDALGIKRADFQ